MKNRIRIWYRQRVDWFLGRFHEVRMLRKLETTTVARLREASAKELEQRKARERAEVERARTLHELEETKRALEIMTTARINAEHAVEVVRGQMAVAESHVLSVKQMTDWFALESRRRPVFGVAPAGPAVTDNSEPVTGRMSARHLQQEESRKFFEELQRKAAAGEPLPNEGPEYSSTSHAQNPT